MFSDIIGTAELYRLQKNILKKSAMFFDPLGLICPLVLQVKLLFKDACILYVKREDLLPTEFVVKYNHFIEELQKITIHISTALFIYRPAERYRVRVNTVSVMHQCKHIRLLFLYDHRKITILLSTY